MGNGLGEGAREKTNGDVGWAKGGKLRKKARSFAGDIGGSSSAVGEGGKMGYSRARYMESRMRLCKGVLEERVQEKIWSP